MAEEEKSDQEQLSDLVKIVKSDLNTYIKIKILQTNPEWQSLVTRKLIIDTLIYIDGFGACLKEYIKFPLNKEEVQEFLKSEAFSYIHGRIEELQKDK